MDQRQAVLFYSMNVFTLHKPLRLELIPMRNRCERSITGSDRVYLEVPKVLAMMLKWTLWMEINAVGVTPRFVTLEKQNSYTTFSYA